MYSRDIKDSHKTVRKKKGKKGKRHQKEKGKCLKQPWLSKNPQKVKLTSHTEPLDYKNK